MHKNEVIYVNKGMCKQYTYVNPRGLANGWTLQISQSTKRNHQPRQSKIIEKHGIKIDGVVYTYQEIHYFGNTLTAETTFNDPRQEDIRRIAGA